ncbi:SsgA family sporulation/cell division regulator, partial [Streptomyces sp. NPDC096068]|uniref:SsgA family sporulation/cell division regulator n=1 Tax=Streptomyces sp. NPDC096068 TaxID=3155424 RepID=UPI003326F84B
GAAPPPGPGGSCVPPPPPTEPERLSDVSIRLQVGGDRALFRASAPPLVAFLDRTDKLVPLGQERTLGDFEDNLEAALGRILAEENAGPA